MAIYKCPKCDMKLNIHGIGADVTYKCKVCGYEVRMDHNMTYTNNEMF